MSTLQEIIAERRSWGDPFGVTLDEAESFAGGKLHRVAYENGRWEYLPNDRVHQCSWNAGGDPASGCDTIINPYKLTGLCDHHEIVVEVLNKQGAE